MDEAPKSKRCPRCNQEKLLNTELWQRNITRSDGFGFCCKDCARSRDRQKIKAYRQKNTQMELEVTAQLPQFEIEEIVPADNRPLPRAGTTSVLAIPDIHFPFYDERGMALMLELAEVNQPGLIIQMGDLYDFLSYSKYPHSVNVMTPQEEVDLGRRQAVEMWTELQQRCPKARCVQLTGNHDARVNRRVETVLPSVEHLVQPVIRALFQFDGVETIHDTRQEFDFEGVLYHHGHRLLGQHVAWNLRNTVNGHLHRGGLVCKQTEGGTLWELNAGFLGDKSSPAFTYHAQKRLHGTTLGVGWIDCYGPRFIPFS